MAILYGHANKAYLKLKKKNDVVVVFPSVCVDQIVAVSCWSVQRADREELPYGKTGRRERESESTTS